MAIDRGHGIATSSVLADAFDVDTLVAQSKAALAGSETAETNAKASETAASTSATAAATSATASASSATASAASAASITGDAAAAAASATAAATSATAAATSKTGADTAKTAAETAKTAAETAETSAETAEAAALVSKNAAATSASSASSSASTATTQATTATTKASEAAASAASITGDAAAAATSATAAAASATTASTKASEASTSAATATTKASQAATSATASAASATAAAATKDSIDEFYLGAKSSDPSVDNNGNAVTAGDWYFRTSDNTTRIYSGSAWQATVVATDSFLSRSGGEMTGNITMAGSQTVDGVDISTLANTSGTNTGDQTIALTGDVTGNGTGSFATTIANDAVTVAKLNLISTGSVPSLEAKGTSGVTDGYIQLNCAENSHGIKLKSPPHSAGASYTLTFPNDDGDANQYLKTNGSGVLDWDTVDALPTQTNNSGKFLTTNGSAASWAVLDTDANTTTKGLYEMANTIAANYSIASGNNAMTAGPITINSGVSVTVPTGSTWVVA